MIDPYTIDYNVDNFSEVLEQRARIKAWRAATVTKIAHGEFTRSGICDQCYAEVQRYPAKTSCSIRYVWHRPDGSIELSLSYQACKRHLAESIKKLGKDSETFESLIRQYEPENHYDLH